MWTTSSDNVTCVIFECWMSPPRNAAQEFTLKPRSSLAIIDFPVAQDFLMKVGVFNVSKMPVNSNIDAARKKLQRTSKDTSIVNDWI